MQRKGIIFYELTFFSRKKELILVFKTVIKMPC
ncbi:Hypothetical protein Minf_0335 [Methylacidiphilum infernorum V4]|uniref:Uncharacterized protein n=1 Tax=Methylacidiphilum infernorum (isolate V4) TaxID=481448 RepID=B3DYB6_METI4|nr:Hypothetical protein Minf_0335 [Methylacidiphilum infernorum V4]